ncbi:RDD family protein [Pseudoduganella violaceinigra]|uniref:RDD family protein n=1 Tax=Pseudoduganella violaceinigra TaxID=246602 RepID=UPI0004110B23|nr:RDD family protein [Pseudoduganella violaceinigra]
MHNPYQAPVATLEQGNQEGDSTPAVGGFWPRVGAKIIDFLVMLPIVGLTIWLSAKSRSFYFWAVIPSLLFAMFYSVYLVRRFGGTPGKLALKLRVQMKDHSPVSFTAALIREAPLMLMGAASNLGLGMAAMQMDDATYMALGFMERSTMLVATGPGWVTIVSWLINAWTLVGAIVLLLNERRRAVHDFLAGTVVVKVSK